MSLVAWVLTGPSLALHDTDRGRVVYVVAERSPDMREVGGSIPGRVKQRYRYCYLVVRYQFDRWQTGH